MLPFLQHLLHTSSAGLLLGVGSRPLPVEAVLVGMPKFLLLYAFLAGLFLGEQQWSPQPLPVETALVEMPKLLLLHAFSAGLFCGE